MQVPSKAIPAPDARRRMQTTPADTDPVPAFAAGMRSHAGEAARMLKLLAHEMRMLVLCHLAAGELSVGEINARVPLSQSALSQHLAVLRAEGVVATRRDGHNIYYRLDDARAARLLAVLYEMYCKEDAAC